MNVVMFIDYANLFINFSKIYNTSEHEFIEKKICECVNKTTAFVKKKRINIVGKVAYVLPDKSFGSPEARLQTLATIKVVRVVEDKAKKNEVMKEMNASRADDKALSHGVINMIQNKNIHGIMIISNDNDFSEVGKKVRYEGKYFYTGIVNAKTSKGQVIRGGSQLMKMSDEWFPLYDILENKDEGECLGHDIEPVEHEKGPRLDFYQNGQLIISYPINKKNISIGRRSLRRNHVPNIDLTDFDVEKVVSRQHAEICKIGQKLIFSIHNNCTRGTWIGRKASKAGEQSVLNANIPVLLGARQGGVIMVYKDK